MIYGIQAAQPDSGSSAPADDYPGSLAVADFLNGIYSAGSTILTLADVVDEPQYITASGLLLDWNDINQQPMNLIGLIRDVICDVNWTIVFEWEEIEVDGMSPFFITDTQSNGYDYLWIDSGNTSVYVYDHPDPGTNREAGIVSSVQAQPGIRKIAVTRTTTNLAISLLGGAVVSDTTSSDKPSMTMVGLGGDTTFVDDGLQLRGYIRKIIVYPAQSDTALLTLSAL